MDVEDEGNYRFHTKPPPDGGRSGITTNDDPFFQVGFGRRSKVEYHDGFNEELTLGAWFGQDVEVGTHFLIEEIAQVPPDLTKEDYARLILQRIRAAGKKDGYSVVFTGPLGDGS